MFLNQRCDNLKGYVKSKCDVMAKVLQDFVQVFRKPSPNRFTFWHNMPDDYSVRNFPIGLNHSICFCMIFFQNPYCQTLNITGNFHKESDHPGRSPCIETICNLHISARMKPFTLYMRKVGQKRAVLWHFHLKRRGFTWLSEDSGLRSIIQ